MSKESIHDHLELRVHAGVRILAELDYLHAKQVLAVATFIFRAFMHSILVTS